MLQKELFYLLLKLPNLIYKGREEGREGEYPLLLIDRLLLGTQLNVLSYDPSDGTNSFCWTVSLFLFFKAPHFRIYRISVIEGTAPVIVLRTFDSPNLSSLCLQHYLPVWQSRRGEVGWVKCLEDEKTKGGAVPSITDIYPLVSCVQFTTESLEMYWSERYSAGSRWLFNDK